MNLSQECDIGAGDLHAWEKGVGTGLGKAGEEIFDSFGDLCDLKGFIKDGIYMLTDGPVEIHLLGIVDIQEDNREFVVCPPQSIQPFDKLFGGDRIHHDKVG
jgi:hypothetical protein